MRHGSKQKPTSKNIKVNFKGYSLSISRSTIRYRLASPRNVLSCSVIMLMPTTLLPIIMGKADYEYQHTNNDEYAKLIGFDLKKVVDKQAEDWLGKRKVLLDTYPVLKYIDWKSYDKQETYAEMKNRNTRKQVTNYTTLRERKDMKHNVKAKIITDQSITILTDMEPLTIRQGQPNFATVAKLIHEGNMDEAIDILLTPIADHIARVSEGNITVENGEVMFRGNEIHHVVADKILKMLENDSKDYLPLVRFVDKLFQNPSQRARNELYDFLSYRALPITESGNVLGYKGVREDHFSCSGNLSTRVISGHVDGQGRIRNQVGDYLEVERSDVDDNREVGCSSGSARW